MQHQCKWMSIITAIREYQALGKTLPSNGVELQEMLSPGCFPKVPGMFCLVLLVMKAAAAGKLLGKGPAFPIPSGPVIMLGQAAAVWLCCNSTRRDKFRSHY